jgi:hypothetical protein
MLATEGYRGPNDAVGQILIRVMDPVYVAGEPRRALTPDTQGTRIAEIARCRRDVQAATRKHDPRRAIPAFLLFDVQQITWRLVQQLCFMAQLGTRMSTNYAILPDDVTRTDHAVEVFIRVDKVRITQTRTVPIGCNCVQGQAEVDRKWCLLHNPLMWPVPLPIRWEDWGDGTEPPQRKKALQKLGWTMQSFRRYHALATRHAIEQRWVDFNVTAWMLGRGWKKLSTFLHYSADYQQWKHLLPNPEKGVPVLGALRVHAIAPGKQPPGGSLPSTAVTFINKGPEDEYPDYSDSEGEADEHTRDGGEKTGPVCNECVEDLAEEPPIFHKRGKNKQPKPHYMKTPFGVPAGMAAGVAVEKSGGTAKQRRNSGAKTTAENGKRPKKAALGVLYMLKGKHYVGEQEVCPACPPHNRTNRAHLKRPPCERGRADQNHVAGKGPQGGK